MVLCELMTLAPEAFLFTWAVMALLGTMSIFLLSGAVFVPYFWRPTYDRWRYKINPKFPSPGMVRMEILQTLKGILAATFLPALSLYLSQKGLSHAYCGVGEHGWGYLALSFLVTWVATDLWEFTYHYIGHSFSCMWAVHRHHHKFYNPSPFAVIADEPLDQLVRAAPMVLLPLLAPVNMDLLFLQFGVFFYAYGVYLHWGYELSWPDAHHPWLNTSYQHFCHHAVSVAKKPYHTGFYFRLWDDLAGSVYPVEKCFCSKCAREKGERSREAWEKVEKPDYSVLLSPSFWLHGEPAKGGKQQ